MSLIVHVSNEQPADHFVVSIKCKIYKLPKRHHNDVIHHNLNVFSSQGNTEFYKQRWPPCLPPTVHKFLVMSLGASLCAVVIGVQVPV